MSQKFDNTAGPLIARLEELRREFDSSFARPWRQQATHASTILRFTAQGLRFAAPLADLESLARAGDIVPVPARAAGLLGLTVVRARLMPVYSLARLTDLREAATQPVWLAVLRGAAPAALALDSLDGYADESTISAVPEGSAPRFVRGSVGTGQDLRPLLDCATLYRALTRSLSADTKGQDQTL